MANHPNIIVITSHDTGRHLGCYGAAGAPSPRIDALAARGALMTQAFCSQTQCSPSRASIVTGQYPHTNGVMGLSHAHFRWNLNRTEHHIANLLKGQGYRTVLCGLQHESNTPDRLGFDVMTGRGNAEQVAGMCESQLADLATDRMQPFYMQVGFFETHRGGEGMQFSDYPPVDEAQVKVPGWLKDEPASRDEFAKLGGSLRALDQAVGRIVDAVDANGLTDETIIVFTVDHGLPFPRAKTSLYDPGMEVGMIVTGPGIEPGQQRDELISNVDLLPTLFERAGIDVPDHVEGRSFAPLITGGSCESREAVFCEMTYHNYCDPMRCVRTARHKLIVNFMPTSGFFNCTQQWRPRTQAAIEVQEPAGKHPLVELYDLQADPLEHHDLAEDESHAEVRKRLLDRLAEHMHATNDPLLRGLPLPPMFRDAQALLARPA